jgi:NADH-quinone oxidoreductase subunit L
MDGILKAFPPNDFALLWVILLLPLIGAAINGIFGKRLGRGAVTLMALTAVGIPFLASVVTYIVLLKGGQGEAHSGAHAVTKLYVKGWEWMSVSLPRDAGTLSLDVAFSIDALSGTMALVVTGVGFLIHLYSTKYMEHDPGYHRFFAYLNLFIFSMLVLILGDNLPVLFVGWEGVGLCSYLLIGFWFQEDKNAQAGRKAFVTNRIGDFGLLVAMALLVYYGGRLDWTGIGTGANQLLTPIDLTSGVGQPLELVLTWLGLKYVNAATLIALFLFLGCAGKSAQLPLYVWLPDAMAGPTPVSALIHAATMVTAGVYLVCRMAPVFVLSPAAMFTIAFVGALTALFAATIAFAQRDIKKVLAYSTVSQLGFMFLGVGVGAFTAGFFHVITHAFFKACLFLGAGSVIHAMHARIHDGEASQDMRYMGGLRKFMPLTFWTFVASWAAIVGLPFTSGFFSKDEILFKAFTSSVVLPDAAAKLRVGTEQILVTQWPSWGSTTLFVMAVAAATMTAFYMSRLVIGTFFGEFKGWRIVEAPHAVDGHSAHDVDHDAHGDDDAHAMAHHGPVAGLELEGPKPQESPWQMTVPLLILGFLALTAGFLNAHPIHVTPLEHVLEPVFDGLSNIVVRKDAKALEHVLLIPGVLAFAVGVFAAYWVYISKRGKPAESFATSFPGLYRLVYEKWRIDELYQETVIGALEIIADVSVWIDRWIIDGIIARMSAFLVSALGAMLRLFQSGKVQAYATLVVVGLLGIGWHLATPHARVAVKGDATSGKYVLSASEGLGYGYRWDENGDGKYETDKFGNRNALDLELSRAEKRTVTLQVVNALGRTTEKTISIERPREDKSRGVTRIDVYDDGRGGKRGVVAKPRGATPNGVNPSGHQRAPGSPGNAPVQGNQP